MPFIFTLHYITIINTLFNRALQFWFYITHGLWLLRQTRCIPTLFLWIVLWGLPSLLYSLDVDFTKFTVWPADGCKKSGLSWEVIFWEMNSVVRYMACLLDSWMHLKIEKTMIFWDNLLKFEMWILDFQICEMLFRMGVSYVISGSLQHQPEAHIP